MRRIRNRIFALSVLALAGVLAEPAESQSVYDDIWRFADWYHNDENPVVQSVRFSGRFQYEFAAVDGEDANHDEWNVRRMRMGVKTVLFEDFTFHIEADLDPQERDPFYNKLTDFYLEWAAGDQLELTVGKHGVPFTMDGSTSSKELLTIDRSNLANNMWFTEEYIPGVSAAGESGPWAWRAGVFSAGGANRELGRFDGGVFTLASLGYDFGANLGLPAALVRGNYVYQQPDPDNTFTRPLHHVLSVNLDLDAGRWGLRTDVSSAAGYLGQSDLWGVMAMPYFDLTPQFQVVGRYTHLDSEGANGVRLARYESQTTAGRGDEYNELYVGANYYFYGHKLKLQSGVTFADMNDTAADGGAYSGVASTTGLRVSW
jgi:phosphate-selective porin OprO/OprP